MKYLLAGFLITTIVCVSASLFYALYNQEKVYVKYENDIHRNYCQIAESREASYEYLVSNGCK